MRRILFLDRGGALVAEPNGGPMDALDNLRLMPGVIPALLRFKAKMQALENAYNQLAARSGTDVDKRALAYQTIFDKAISQNYLMPLLKVPSIVVYHKDVVLEGGHKSPEGYWYNYIAWAK